MLWDYALMIKKSKNEAQILNGMSVSNTRISVDTRRTLVEHLLVKCSIQKIFVEFMKI